MQQITKALGQIRRQSKLVAGILVGLVAGGIGSAAVLAIVPDSNGMIHGCYRNSTGSLRIIDTSTQTCNVSNETDISWNQTGPQGPPGSGGSVLVSNLVGANLDGAVMVGWDLSNKDFTNAHFGLATIGSSDLTGATFTGAHFNGGRLHHLDFSGHDLTGVVFDDGIMSDMDFSGANLTNAQIGTGLFTAINTNFSNANLTNADIQWGFYDDVDFTNANFSGAEFIWDSNSDFRFTRVNFTGVDLTGFNISGIVWNDTICPDGTNSNSHSNTCAGHLAP